MLAAASASAQGDDNPAADWSCADALIAKNYSQPFKARELALRIADECTVPFTPSNDPTIAQQPLLQAYDRQIYDTQKLTFVYQIATDIERRRRKDAIPLTR